MKPIHLYIRDVDGQQIAASEEMLQESKVTVEGMGEVALSSRALIEEYFGGGTWHTVTLKGPMKYKDEAAIEKAITVLTSEKEWERQSERYYAVLVAHMTESWTFTQSDGTPLPITEEGFGELHDMVAKILAVTVQSRLFPAWTKKQDFTTPSTSA